MALALLAHLREDRLEGKGNFWGLVSILGPRLRNSVLLHPSFLQRHVTLRHHLSQRRVQNSSLTVPNMLVGTDQRSWWSCLSPCPPQCCPQSPVPSPFSQRPHHAPGLVVVQVHEETQVSALLTGVHKLPPKEATEVDVVTAAPPVPVRAPRATAPVVTGAGLDGTLRARPGHRVCHASAGDGKDECCLPAACGGSGASGCCWDGEGAPTGTPNPPSRWAGDAPWQSRGALMSIPTRGCIEEVLGTPVLTPSLTPVDNFAEDVGAL